jgi:flagellar biogenesis protein FliO
MDSLQGILPVILVLALLAGVVIWLKRSGLPRLGVKLGGRARSSRLQVLERLPLSPQHSLQLVRVADRGLLVAIHPGGCTVVGALSPEELKSNSQPIGTGSSLSQASIV